jgi:hypothetical protein
MLNVETEDFFMGFVTFRKIAVLRNGVPCCHNSLNINRAFAKKKLVTTSDFCMGVIHFIVRGVT